MLRGLLKCDLLQNGTNKELINFMIRSQPAVVTVAVLWIQLLDSDRCGVMLEHRAWLAELQVNLSASY